MATSLDISRRHTFGFGHTSRIYTEILSVLRVFNTDKS